MLLSTQSEQFLKGWEGAANSLEQLSREDRDYLLAKYEEEARQKGLLSDLREIRKLKIRFSMTKPPAD